MIVPGRSWWLACITPLTLLLGGASCGLLSPKPDTTRFAVLASVDELGSVAPSSGEAGPSLYLGLGPITIPDYLRRAALVTREDGTRLVPSPTERWAEPFDRSLERVLAIDLRREPGVGSLIVYPWYESERPAVQVEIAFSRCERDESSGVVVAARWEIRWLDGSRAPIARETRLERPVASADGAETAKAISEALAELCREIGNALR